MGYLFSFFVSFWGTGLARTGTNAPPTQVHHGSRLSDSCEERILRGQNNIKNPRRGLGVCPRGSATPHQHVSWQSSPPLAMLRQHVVCSNVRRRQFRGGDAGKASALAPLEETPRDGHHAEAITRPRHVKDDHRPRLGAPCTVLHMPRHRPTVAAPACVPRLPPPTKTSLLNLKTSPRRGEYPSRCSTRAIAHDMAPIGGRNHVLADGGGSCGWMERFSILLFRLSLLLHLHS